MLPNHKKFAGFSLFELVIVMGLVAILATIGIPSFKYVTTSNRISSEVNGLLGDMQYARSEAIKEGLTVTVCASSNPTASPPSCSGSTSWQSGWIIFTDPGSTQTVVAGTPILRAQTAFASTDTLVANNTVEAVSFGRQGLPLSGAIGAVAFVNSVLFTLHDSTDNSQWTRCLALNTASSTNGLLATEKVGTGGCT
jgi:type IV fimbrial biogenesis protein FimT